MKIFRTNRKKILGRNQVIKYLAYATGEIILVVIGIYLAMQLGNWNEKKQRRSHELKVLNEFLVNLRLDSADHIQNLEIYRMVENSSRIVVEQLDAQAPWHDSMSFHYPKLMMHGLSTLNTSSYENLKSIGFDLISSDSLREAITHYYEVDCATMIHMEKELAADNLNQVIAPVVLKRIRMTLGEKGTNANESQTWSYATPIDYPSLLKDDEFREVARWKAITSAFVAYQFEIALEQTNLLIAKIEKEVKKRQ